MRIINTIGICAIAAVVLLHFTQSSKPPDGPTPPPATSAKMLMKYDANNKDKLPDHGAMLDSPTFRTYLEAHHVDWRIVPATTTFNDDQPVFQKLDAQERKGDNWLYLDAGRRKLSQELPANESDATKLIGRYVR